MTQFFEGGGNPESVFFKISSLWDYGIRTTDFAFQSPNVKKFINNDQTKFDLVIAEQFQQEAFNMLAHKYNCPLVVVGTLDWADFMDRAKGAMTPLSHVPHFLSPSTDKMTFFERIENTVYSLFDALGRKFYYLPKQTQLARFAFEALENQQGGVLPTVDQLETRIAVHLINSHPALSYPRPKMPGMIDIAGIHIKKPKELPEDIKKFIESATDGVIYISFGSFLRSSEMPPEKFEAMMAIFRKIKQKVIWKWEKDEIKNLPANVLVKKWLPQADILAHKNVKIFIGHGGIFGTQEAIFHAVPMILFPFYGDQHLNSHKMQERGLGIMQSMSTISSESLLDAINKVANNQSFYENIQKLSEIFRTNQNEPLETAIWWIEYVIKFKGAPHIQSHAKNLPWFRYLQLDIVFMIFGSIYCIYDFIKERMAAKAKNDDEKVVKKAEKRVDKNNEKKGDQGAKKIESGDGEGKTSKKAKKNKKKEN